MQGNWTVCVPLKYLILMPDIQEAKCFEFTVQISPPPLGGPRGGKQFFALRKFRPPLSDFFSGEVETERIRTRKRKDVWRKQDRKNKNKKKERWGEKWYDEMGRRTE